MATGLRGTLSLLAIAVAAGCGSGEQKPSYADLVVTYNAEVQALDRLQDKRAELLARFASENQPDLDQTVEALAGALKTATQTDAQEAESATDAFAALDAAIAQAERTGQATADVLDAVGQSPDGTPVALTEAQQQELAALDAEIKEQQARVERARAARDAAEAK